MSMSRQPNCWIYRCFGTRHTPSNPASTATGNGSSNTGSRRIGDRRRRRSSRSVTGADCSYAPKPTPVAADFTNQARCALTAVQALLQRLRDLGLYDRSAIIVTSDHGMTLDLVAPEDQRPLRGIRSPAGVTLAKIESWATPLLLLKPFGARGPLQTSYAPTSIADIPATLLDLADLPDARDLALLSCVSILRRPASARMRTTIRTRDRTPSTTSCMSSPSTDRSPTRKLGAITGRYSGRRTIVHRNAGSFRSDCPQLRMTQQTRPALASIGPTDTQPSTRRPRTRALRSMSAGYRRWPPPRR